MRTVSGKMEPRLPKEKELFFMQELEEICKNSRILQSHKYIQHGDTSVFRHSVSVAYYSYYLAWKMHMPVDEKSLIRGALLHDYFLYDWHEKDASHKWHGFHHARKALQNAMEDFDLNEVESGYASAAYVSVKPETTKVYGELDHLLCG